MVRSKLCDMWYQVTKNESRDQFSIEWMNKLLVLIFRKYLQYNQVSIKCFLITKHSSAHSPDSWKTHFYLSSILSHLSFPSFLNPYLNVTVYNIISFLKKIYTKISNRFQISATFLGRGRGQIIDKNGLSLYFFINAKFVLK